MFFKYDDSSSMGVLETEFVLKIIILNWISSSFHILIYKCSKYTENNFKRWRDIKK